MSIHSALIDLDDTLVATQETRIAYINAVADTDYKFNTITKEFTDDPLDPFERLGKLFLEEPDHECSVLAIPLHAESLLGLQALKDAGVKLYIGTSRKDNWHESTTIHLQRAGIANLVEGIYMRPEAIPSVIFKLALAQTIRPDVMFDDSHSTCAALNFVPYRYLIDRPWNQDLSNLDPGIKRATNFFAATSDYLSRVV